jgi:hypothetical protein
MLAVDTISAGCHFWRPSPPKRVSGIPTGTPMSLKGRDQMDTSVVPLLRGQRRASSAPHPHQGNFMRMLAMPKAAESWSLTSLREKLIKVGAKVVSHGRYVTFQMAEVAVSQRILADILSLIARLRAPPKLA